MRSTSHEGSQKSIMPRLLISQARRIQELGMQPCRLVGPFKEAPGVLKSSCRDGTLQTAKALSLYHYTVHKGDVLFLANGIAGVVEEIVFGEQTAYSFWLKKLQCLKSCGWGRVWQSQESHLFTPALSESWTLPPWWRWDDDALTTLL